MKQYFYPAAELVPIFITAIIPLFVDLSYQINLYLAWEGAYRLYEGQVPYRDFGMPMGYCYWILPAIFFKIFGPSLFALAKTQAFVHLISGVSFRWILLRIGASFEVRFLSILIFCLTFILGLHWPQYNHHVIVFQFLALGFLLQYLLGKKRKLGWMWMAAGCFFLVYSFLIKQDAGALGILIATALTGYYCYVERTFKPALLYATFLLIFFAIAIIPFIQFGFGYWFNYGQPPHYSRISVHDILRIVFGESRWEKFYFVLVTGVFLVRWYRKQTITREEALFTLLTLGIIAEALIFQVTSYVPRDNNIFVHAFSGAYLLYQLDRLSILRYRLALPAMILFIGIWWSEKYWKYIERLYGSFVPPKPVNENVVSINTYVLGNDHCNYYADMSTWVTSPVPSFRHVRMPAGTAQGIEWFLQYTRSLDTNARVLNMSELTPLAHEVPFKLETGVPLWFHLNVGMFDKELAMYRNRIQSSYYDIVLYEYLPEVNNFYPFSLRKLLQERYQLVKSFDAPRSMYLGSIEIYCPKASVP